MKSANSPSKPQADFEAWEGGLARDGNLLVVDLRRYEFPSRCVKSNRPVADPPLLLKLIIDNPPTKEVERLEAHRQLGDDDRIQVTSGKGSSVSVQLPIPLSPRWRWLLHLQWGYWLMGLGAGGFVLFWLYLLLLKRLEYSDELRIGAALFPLSIVTFILGLLTNVVISWFLSICRLAECKIWIRGVHRDWLRGLPEFVPSCRMLVQEIEVETRRFWSMILAAGMLLAIACYAIRLELPHDLMASTVAVALHVGVAITILIGDSARRKLRHRRTQLKTLYTDHEPTSPWWRRRRQSRRDS